MKKQTAIANSVSYWTEMAISLRHALSNKVDLGTRSVADLRSLAGNDFAEMPDANFQAVIEVLRTRETAVA